MEYLSFQANITTETFIRRKATLWKQPEFEESLFVKKCYNNKDIFYLQEVSAVEFQGLQYKFPNSKKNPLTMWYPFNHTE